MAQLLVFMRDNTNPDYLNDQREFKKGDVIAINADGIGFGSDELQYPFRVVSVVGTRDEWKHLLESEPATARDVYTRSMMSIRRLRRKLDTESKKSVDVPYRRQRRHRVTTSDNIITKPLGAA